MNSVHKVFFKFLQFNQRVISIVILIGIDTQMLNMYCCVLRRLLLYFREVGLHAGRRFIITITARCSRFCGTCSLRL